MAGTRPIKHLSPALAARGGVRRILAGAALWGALSQPAWAQTASEPPAPALRAGELWDFQPPPRRIPPAGSASDVSFVLDAPAGKHGALRTSADGHLAFADGARVRFFGVNLADEAAFPDHATAERLAARLARAGVNLVRLTHLDAAWGRRSLFFSAQSKGTSAGTRRLAEDSLERLDYLRWQLQQRGIYVMLTLLSARRFAPEDGVADAEDLAQGGSLVAHFNRRLIELQKEHAAHLLGHRSRYSGQPLATDPQLALLEITNEDTLFASDRFAERLPPRYREELYRRVRTLQAGADPRRRPLDAGTRAALLTIERGYFGEMRAHLRALGVTIPIAHSNWFDGLGPALLVDAEGDFVSRHSYWDHPQGGWTAQDRFDNRSMLRHPLDSIIAHLAPLRVVGKPFVAVEWGLCWPNDYIAEGPLVMAAYANLQGWDGVLAFNVSTPDASDTLLGTGAHEVFDIGAKPHVFAQLPAAALLFHRGAAGAAGVLVTPGTEVVSVTAEALLRPAARKGPNSALSDSEGSLSIHALFDAHDALERPLAVHILRGVGPAAPPTLPTWNARSLLAAPGLRWDAAAGVLTITTPQAVAVVGACQALPRFTLQGITLALQTPFCAVSVTALSSAPQPAPRSATLAGPGPPGPQAYAPASGAAVTLASAQRLLVTVVARAENSGMVFSADRRHLRDAGHAPLRLQRVRGQLTLPPLPTGAPGDASGAAREAAAVTVWPLGADGQRLAPLAPGPGDGVIQLPSDASQGAPALWYEIRRGPPPSDAPR